MTYEDWPVIWPCDTAPQATAPQLARALQIAREILWARTGYRLGLGTITERYQVPAGQQGCPIPYLGRDGLWDQGIPGGAPIVLLQQPVHDIVSVAEDGATIDPTGYRLEGARLYRLGTSWAASVTDQAPRVTVTYRFGIPLDVSTSLGAMAAAALGEVATEVHNALCGQKCRLPSRALTVTRQGVTVGMANPSEQLEADLLGLPLADTLIQTVNPNRARARSRVYSPDMARVNTTSAP